LERADGGTHPVVSPHLYQSDGVSPTLAPDMDSRALARRTGGALAFTLTITIVVGAVSYDEIRRLEQANQSLEHSHLVVDQLQQVLYTLIDAETGERGFALTGGARYLEPYNRAIASIQRTIDSLSTLTRDDPAEEGSLRAIQALADAKLVVMREIIDARAQAGLPAAIRILDTDRGKNIMDDLRVRLGEMRLVEQAELAARAKTADADVRRVRVTVALLAPLSWLLLAIVAAYLLRTLRYSEAVAPRPVRREGWGAVAMSYLFAVAAVVIAAGARQLLSTIPGSTPPSLTFYPAVLVVASVAGIGPGVVATLLSAIVTDYFFVAPIGSFRVGSTADLTSLTVFICTNLAFCALSARLRRAQWSEAVTAQRALLAVALGSIDDGVIVADLDGRVSYINSAAARLARCQSADAEGQSLSSLFTLVDEVSRAPMDDLTGMVLRRASLIPATHGHDTVLVARDGCESVVEVAGARVRSEGGLVDGAVFTIRDCTEGRRIEAELQASNECFAVASDAAGLGFWRFDIAANTVKWDDRMYWLYGHVPSAEVQPYSLWATSLHPDDRAEAEQALVDALNGTREFDTEFRIVRPDGGVRHLKAAGRIIRDIDGRAVQMFGVNFDITDRKVEIAQLRTLSAQLEHRVVARTAELKEREILLQEIHHRVKNNLQVISSLINMQIRTLQNASSRLALEECQARVETMALIHEMLYRSKDYANVPFDEYATTLASRVFSASDASMRAVGLDLALDALSLPVDRAIPCGLILNELISNALKHAFPDGATGTVRVELRRAADQRIVLAIGDNGVGVADSFEPRTARSLGVQLVSALVKQLSGEMEIIRHAGTTFRITFPAEAPG
jgi:PAS domain S-box-containing protein